MISSVVWRTVWSFSTTTWKHIHGFEFIFLVFKGTMDFFFKGIVHPKRKSVNIYLLLISIFCYTFYVYYFYLLLSWYYYKVGLIFNIFTLSVYAKYLMLVTLFNVKHFKLHFLVEKCYTSKVYLHYHIYSPLKLFFFSSSFFERHWTPLSFFVCTNKDFFLNVFFCISRKKVIQ